MARPIDPKITIIIPTVISPNFELRGSVIIMGFYMLKIIYNSNGLSFFFLLFLASNTCVG